MFQTNAGEINTRYKVCIVTHMLHSAVLSHTLQHSATQCNTLQHTALHCNTLQRTAKHCNALQHTCDVLDADLTIRPN